MSAARFVIVVDVVDEEDPGSAVEVALERGYLPGVPVAFVAAASADREILDVVRYGAEEV